VKKIDENTVEETYLRKGKVITVARMAVDPNGKTMKISVEDKLRNATINWTADKL
jgi:acetylglutamate kinase